ncbi:DUF3050 domain-containing protein, partial [Planctomycetaceae bacterium]|nr:DUF3050 domain-containing protein [Planctomycetaceae bacterium]
AVWDFMSLLKALQQRFTGLQTPWLPVHNKLACRLINEIVLGEESDEDGTGEYASHFDLYHQAMQTCGCETFHIDQLIERLRNGSDLESAVSGIDISPATKQFIMSTFAWIQQGSDIEIAAAFTFGREDLLPDVFRKIVGQIDREESGQLQPFLYYLDRHIELDEDRHGPMADRLMADLCGDDPESWKLAEQAAIRALQLRINLWDEITAKVVTRSPASC